jgi:putative nucleotidyltransferase with HDIG domain
MIDQTRRLQFADELLRRFAAALRAIQLYSAKHPLVGRNLESLAATLLAMHVYDPSVAIGFVKGEVVVGDTPMPKAAETMGDLPRRLRDAGIERIVLERGVTATELGGFMDALARIDSTRADGGGVEGLASEHIRVGRLQIEDRVEGTLADTATIRRLYNEAVSVATLVWESARTESKPDPTAARAMVDGLAQAVSQNRTALLALTALKDYDNYTFTHMVNVSILTMAQARAVGVDGPLLREFGLAALMHDIGKVRTPPEILNKPDKLDDAEFTIMRRHTLDGAEILRRTPEIPALAPVVAFEHHLRIDGSGYPFGVRRPSLNLATMMCGVADVYDAMRSQRSYQQAFPTDRILAVLQRNDGTQFDQHLVRRFVQLLGIYPAGNLVKLDTGEVAVVVRVHAPDPYRPKVRVIFARDGRRLELPHEVNLWDGSGEPGMPSSVVGPLNPADYGVDPLTLL